MCQVLWESEKNCGSSNMKKVGRDTDLQRDNSHLYYKLCGLQSAVELLKTYSPGLQIYHQPRVTLTLDLLTPKVDNFMPRLWTTCANSDQIWFIRFQNIVFTSLLTDEWWGWEHYMSACQSNNNSSYGRRAFCVAGPSVWNSLPDSLRDPIIGGTVSDSFAMYWCI